MPRDTDYPSYLPKNVVREMMLRPSYAEGQKTGSGWPYPYKGSGKEAASAMDPKTLEMDPTAREQPLRKQLTSPSPSTLQSFRKGGKVRRTGVYKLHKGEKVVPAKKVKQEARDISMLKKVRYR